MKTLLNGLRQVCKGTNKLTFHSPIGSSISFNHHYNNQPTVIKPGKLFNFTKNDDSLYVLLDLLTMLQMSPVKNKIQQLVNNILSQVSAKESTVIKEYLKDSLVLHIASLNHKKVRSFDKRDVMTFIYNIVLLLCRVRYITDERL